ncbi:MAG: Calx-beta domain-containing protein, partial [Pyrinomonadaceae bacterium]
MSRHLSPFHLSSKRFPRWSFYVFIAVATLCFGFYTFAQTLPALSISDASVIEGEGGGTTNAVFNVNLSATSTQTITVNFATRNNSATAPADYTATSGTLTFAPGERSKTITVPVAADCVAEGTESFFVELTNPVNATISDGFAIGTIQTDDNRSLSIADLSFVEGEGGGTTNAVFTVTLNAINPISAECGPVTVNFATRNNSATAPADYTATSGTLTFNVGETTQTITVPVAADCIAEGTESFFVELSSAANATISDGFAIGTIQTDDNRSLSIADLSFVEGEGGGTTNAIFTVTLNAVNAISAECGPVTVNYATRNNSATAPADYTATTGTLTFNAGETTKTITVPVAADC